MDIDKLIILDGNLPARVLSLVIEWAEQHKQELQNNWDNLQITGEYDKIKPLV